MRHRLAPVVLLQTQSENAGAQEVSRLVGERLAARGYPVHHVFLYRKSSDCAWLGDVRFCAPARPRGPLGVARLLVRLYETLRAIRPATVVTFQHYGNVLGAVPARLAGARVIANQTTSLRQVARPLARADRLLGALGIYDRVVVNSAQTLSEYGVHPASYRDRLVLVEHGFDLKARTLDAQAARAALDLPAGPLLGCVARLHPSKNLEAAIGLLARRQHWRLALAGTGPHEAVLRAHADRLGVADRVTFVGELPPARIGDFLSALDVFVFPTRIETFGLAGVEAAQAGVPVVANDIPILREVLAVDGAPCAAFVDVDDAAALESAVAEALERTPAVAARVARAAGLAERYCASAMADAYAALVEAVAAERAPPRGAGRVEATDDALAAERGNSR
ncbi:glycosyltransferase family 4 protein [Salinarimonas ramus]|uniref:Glycosyl transferase n=1 Tax=Salinarimonas ramus TaxID=690164 RepID=A0A917V3D3_9HYPH|nr:glycosyltransferase family 4 protein [Salinarimonas ramus]GGK34063.1 glycosyl transferase [Salinarimonas ramus]